jgi:23S rRNA pseudouridine955/2504/2580 synthase
MRKFIANDNDSGLRLDKFIKKVLKFAPDSLIYKYIRKKRIKVNGKKEDVSYKLLKGDILEMYVNDDLFFDAVEEENSFLKIKPDLDIIYEDNNIMIIHKKQGVIVHSDEKENFNTLISHIWAYLYQKGEFDYENELSFKPSLCNRIDRNTGGIVIAAKNATTLRCVNEAIKNNETIKKYLCLVYGHLTPKVNTLKAYLFKDEAKKEVYIKNKKLEGYKEIITKYKVLSEQSDTSLVEVHLITGRTHQIRAHFAYIGHPLIGDGKYGKNEINKKYNAKYQYLYSYKLNFDIKDKENPLYYLNEKNFEIEEDYVKRVFKTN